MSSQGFQKQELAKIRRQWLSYDPVVLKQLAKVNNSRKRKMVHSTIAKSNATVKTLEMKKAKREKVKCTFDLHNY